MAIPGEKRSLSADECGLRAGQFAEAIRYGDMPSAWNMLSNESKGVRQGIWATQKSIDIEDDLHTLSYFDDFRDVVLKMWPLEDLTDLGIAPTSYIDDYRAFAFLPFGVVEDEQVVHEGSMLSGLIVPMLREGGEWKVDLPGWRFAWQ